MSLRNFTGPIRTANNYYGAFTEKGQKSGGLLTTDRTGDTLPQRIDIMDDQEFHKRVRKAAHDVRTPITTIAGFADLLGEDSKLAESTRDIAETIAAETRRLSEMLEDFFDEISARPESE